MSDKPENTAVPAAASNFIEDIINEDIAEGRCSEIVTRFPPIGHAKALCINFGVKQKYGGKCNLRFDDTNPEKEDTEYMRSIEKDIRWLGFEWDGKFNASDYFDAMYDCAVSLIKAGKAYVCDLPAPTARGASRRTSTCFRVCARASSTRARGCSAPR